MYLVFKLSYMYLHVLRPKRGHILLIGTVLVCSGGGYSTVLVLKVLDVNMHDPTAASGTWSLVKLLHEYLKAGTCRTML